MSPSRVRAAAKAGARPPAPGARSCAEAIKRSGGPRELGGRQPRLPLVLDAEGVDLDRFASAIVRFEPTGWNMPSKRTGCPVSTPNGTMSSTSKSIASPIRTLWRRPSSTTSIGARSTPSTSPTSGASACHRAAHLPAEDRAELLHLLVGRVLVDEHAETPVALGHDLRRVRDHGDLAPADVRALDLALADVEDESDAAVVVRRAVVEREDCTGT